MPGGIPGECGPALTTCAGQVPQTQHSLSDDEREQAIRDEGDKAMAAWQQAVDARKQARRHFQQMRELIAGRSAAWVKRAEQERGIN